MQYRIHSLTPYSFEASVFMGIEFASHAEETAGLAVLTDKDVWPSPGPREHAHVPDAVTT